MIMDKKITLFFLTIIVGCATSPVNIETMMMVPPAHPEAARYHEIAVMPFDGPGGEETADLLGKALSRATFNGKNIFTRALERALGSSLSH